MWALPALHSALSPPAGGQTSEGGGASEGDACEDEDGRGGGEGKQNGEEMFESGVRNVLGGVGALKKLIGCVSFPSPFFYSRS